MCHNEKMRKNKIIFDKKKTFDEFKPDLDSSLQNTSKVAEVREITSPANVVSEDKKINVSTDEELTEKSERIHPVINTEIFQMIDEYVKTLSIAKEGITPIS